VKAKYISVVVLLVGGLLFGGAPTGFARGGGDPEVIRTGNCTGNSDWKVKLKKDDSKIEVEFEVDQNRNGDTWNVVLRHNGNRFFKDTRVTKAPSGSFTVQRRVNDAAGDDDVTARARNLRTDEVCRGRATI
jgi:hypothetical protein